MNIISNTIIINILNNLTICNWPDNALDFNKASQEEIKEYLKKGMYAILDNFDKILEIINLLYGNGYMSEEIRRNDIQKCHEILLKYNDNIYTVLRKGLVNETTLIFYIFGNIIDMNTASCENFLVFCNKADKILGSHVSQTVENEIGILLSFLSETFTNIKKGKWPDSLPSRKLAQFEEIFSMNITNGIYPEDKT